MKDRLLLTALTFLLTMLAGHAEPGNSASLVFFPNQETDQPKANRSLVVRAVRTSEAIEIDGYLNEATWETAEPATDFIQKLPDAGELASEQTEVRLLYDDENLYVGVYCFDSAGSAGIVVNDISKDFFTLDSDGFQIVLDTFDDNRNGFLFGTNPKAGRFDMQIAADGNGGNSSWDGIWYVETQITDRGWQVEMAIPFKTLRFRRDSELAWGVNFERRVRRKFEDSYWSPLPPPYRLGRVSLAGALEGIEGVQHGRNLWIKPYATAPITRLEGDDVDFKPDAGLDLKYGLSSQLTLDLTLNTDFSQVEADEEQVNLTRFSLYFPEKRDFFLENASIFDWGRRKRGPQQRPELLPFFSRRIGLAEDEDENNVVVPILGGGRMTGRAGPYSVGLLSLQTMEYLGAAPSTNFTVARVRRDILRQSDIGGIFVNKDGMGDGNQNRTYGADANFNFFKYLDLTTYFLRTETPGISDRDQAADFEFAWVDGFFELQAGHLRIGENFNPEVGFAPRTGIHKSSGEFGITPRPGNAIPWIREFNPSIQAEYISDEENVLETRKVESRFSVTFSDSSRLSFGREDNFERLDEPFEIREGQFIDVGDYPFHEYQVFFRSDRSRAVSVEARASTGGFYDGDRDSLRFGLALHPSYKLSSEVSLSRNQIDLVSGAFDTNLISTKVGYSFSNRVFLNALIQYNSVDNDVISNIRFHFLHHPLSDFYLVYNERRASSGDVLDRALIAKLTYLFAF
jgi:hypothetical protein